MLGTLEGRAHARRPEPFLLTNQRWGLSPGILQTWPLHTLKHPNVLWGRAHGATSQLKGQKTPELQLSAGHSLTPREGQAAHPTKPRGGLNTEQQRPATMAQLGTQNPKILSDPKLEPQGPWSPTSWEPRAKAREEQVAKAPQARWCRRESL